MSKLVKLPINQKIQQYTPATVIYYCKKCEFLRKGTVDEDVDLFYQHKDPNDSSKRCLLKGEYIFINGSGGNDVNIYVMTPK